MIYKRYVCRGQRCAAVFTRLALSFLHHNGIEGYQVEEPMPDGRVEIVIEYNYPSAWTTGERNSFKRKFNKYVDSCLKKHCC